MPNFLIENKYSGIIAGCDEAGRGPLAGPVVAASIILEKKNSFENFENLINDSKKLTANKREYIFQYLIENFDYSVFEISEEEIDRINILQASLLAMKNATLSLKQSPDVVLVDGNKGFEISNKKIIPIIGGDAKSLTIAAASIIAKVARDRIMKKLDEEFPHYGWKKNSGYGTKSHLEAIDKFGITKYHRKTFAPIKNQIS